MRRRPFEYSEYHHSVLSNKTFESPHNDTLLKVLLLGDEVWSLSYLLEISFCHIELYGHDLELSVLIGGLVFFLIINSLANILLCDQYNNVIKMLILPFLFGELLQMGRLRPCPVWSLKFQSDFQEVQHCFPICIQHHIATKANKRAMLSRFVRKVYFKWKSVGTNVVFDF